MPGLTLGDTLPNLEVETTQGKIKLHDYVDKSYTIIFSHPGLFIHFLLVGSFLWYSVNMIYVFVGDFTPVCTTELGMMAAYADKFAERGVKLLGLSCDDVNSHNEWIKDIEAFNVCEQKSPLSHLHRFFFIIC